MPVLQHCLRCPLPSSDLPPRPGDRRVHRVRSERTTAKDQTGRTAIRNWTLDILLLLSLPVLAVIGWETGQEIGYRFAHEFLAHIGNGRTPGMQRDAFRMWVDHLCAIGFFALHILNAAVSAVLVMLSGPQPLQLSPSGRRPARADLFMRSDPKPAKACLTGCGVPAASRRIAMKKPGGGSQGSAQVPTRPALVPHQAASCG